MRRDRSEGGWSLVAETDGAARLLEAIVDLDPEAEYTKSALAEAAGVPLKTLFLAETIETFAEEGLLVRLDSPDEEGEARYRIREDGPLYEAARAFDEATTAGRQATATD